MKLHEDLKEVRRQKAWYKNKLKTCILENAELQVKIKQLKEIIVDLHLEHERI